MHRRQLFELAKTLPKIRPRWPIGPHPLPIQMAYVNQWFHTMSDSTRTSILELLSQRERCVSEIQQILDAPQSTVSYHLRVLRESGLVRERRSWRWKVFSLATAPLEEMGKLSTVIGPGKHVGTCPLSCCR